MRTLEPLPNDRYEVFPGCSPPDFAQWFLTHKQITLEAFCKNEGIDSDALPGLVDEVLVEWELKEERHISQYEAVAHMIHHLRKKKNAKRNNPQRPYGQPPRPNQDADERLADFAQELLRQPARRDKP